MGVSQHQDTFGGLKVAPYEAGGGFPEGQPDAVAYRLGGLEYGEAKRTFPETLDAYLGEPGAAATTALVIGAWHYEQMLESTQGSREVIEALVAARDRLPRLRALFLGDILYEECEISWINQGDVSPLLGAYPQLEEFRVRGVGGLTFGRLRHDHLHTLAVESGGLPANVLQEIWVAELPRLEHLELWLGTPEYGGIEDTGPLEPLLSGRLFSRLRHLGLRNSFQTDAVAQAIAAAPVLERLRELDLSLGNLTDEGARALLASPAVRRLEKLDLHHHYLSMEVVLELNRLGINLDATDLKEPHSYTYNNVSHTDRYNAHSE